MKCVPHSRLRIPFGRSESSLFLLPLLPRLYIAVDSLIGFLASNGLATYPRQKIATTLATIATVRELLDAGK